ncbi:unnamed protein product [Larinioides sclopetarius]|uniref:Ethanolaminephosphotransferase n=1 Tax=Larinioides sclopetarius TaxID=280406 RepID=A0AAV1Z0Y4_9ARAC
MYYQYLSPERIKGFENYKYSAIDTSPLSNYVMHPFWNHVVKLVPKWLAPNVLTFTGFLLTLLNAILLAIYDYNFSASSDLDQTTPPVPRWVWLVCAINHFLAHTLDGIDGKHARRTKSSGPLGELMDHGLDSWAALFMPTCMYSVFGCGEYSCTQLRVFFILWSVHLCFIFSHWEKYNTGVLYLPWGYDISQMVLLAAFLTTYFKSYLFWKFTIPILNIGSGEVIEILIYAGTFAMSLPVSLYNIYCAYKKGELKQASLWEAMRPLVPILLLFLSTTIWAVFSPTNILLNDARVFYWLVGTVFSNIACRLIVSQMSSTRCEAFNWLFYPIGLALLYIFSCPHHSRTEVQIAWALLILSILAHIHYGVCVVQQMCRHFKIHCFSLRKDEKD